MRKHIESFGFIYSPKGVTHTKGIDVYFKDNVVLTYRNDDKLIHTFTKDPSLDAFMLKHNHDRFDSKLVKVETKEELEQLLKSLKIID